MTLNAHQLSCLLAIARTGSFSRAALELGQSQPTLSNNIALLERRLGVRVLERSKRGSVLTPHGEILVRRAEGLHTMLEDAELEVRNLDAAINGPLRIGATPSVLPALLSSTLVRLQSEGRNDLIEVIEDLDQALGPKLRNGELDIIVAPVNEPFTQTPDIIEYELLRDRFCIAAGHHSRLGARDAVNLEELVEDAWLLPRIGSTYRRHIESMFLTSGVAWPKKALYVNSLQLLEAMVASNEYITFVSPVQLRLPLTQFKVIKLENGSYRKIGYKVRKGVSLSTLGLRFIAALKKSGLQMEKDFGSAELKTMT
ncbi:LysR family transcriptional regulator [Sphingobium sp.]|uniref:LysR family transcriptional regulator n=1 Tax=Sphingobium sp. TaxID=1912891 RepID=UPI0035C700A4